MTSRPYVADDARQPQPRGTPGRRWGWASVGTRRWARRVAVLRGKVGGGRTVSDNAELVEHRELTAHGRDGAALDGGAAPGCGRRLGAEGLEGARLEGAGRRRGGGGGRGEACAGQGERVQGEGLWRRAARGALPGRGGEECVRGGRGRGRGGGGVGELAARESPLAPRWGPPPCASCPWSGSSARSDTCEGHARA